MKFVSKNVQCPKNIHIRAVAAQMQIIFQLNIFLRIVSIIQTGHINLHFYSFMALYKNAIQDIYNCAVQQNTTQMQITRPRNCFQTNL